MSSAAFWFSPDGESIVNPLRGHEDEVSSPAFSTDGKRIATASRDWSAPLWDAETRRQIGEPLRGRRGSRHEATARPTSISSAEYLPAVPAVAGTAAAANPERINVQVDLAFVYCAALSVVCR